MCYNLQPQTISKPQRKRCNTKMQDTSNQTLKSSNRPSSCCTKFGNSKPMRVVELGDFVSRYRKGMMVKRRAKKAYKKWKGKRVGYETAWDCFNLSGKNENRWSSPRNWLMEMHPPNIKSPFVRDGLSSQTIFFPSSPKIIPPKKVHHHHHHHLPRKRMSHLHVAPTPPPRHANSASGTDRRMLALRDRWRQATVPASTRAQEVVAEFRPENVAWMGKNGPNSLKIDRVS